ncbi:MAG TPA: ATP-grasp domain-containing protein [Gemmatales bacterium]|nr:ATP-grasp domain-containing protein [Gemmatales bacterium]
MKFGITYTLKDHHFDGSKLPDDWQEELDSPVTIDAIAKVLNSLGHEVVKLGDGPELVDRLRQEKPDIVFNLAEGRGVSRSREAWVPALLESMGIPYTASDPLTCAVTLEKDYAKRLVASAGVAVPRDIVIQPGESLPDPKSIKLTYPLLVKPAWEGSSKGIRLRCLVHKPEELIAVVQEVRGDYAQPVLIEEFIQGEELTVGLVGNGSSLESIGILRVVPTQPTEHFVYSLEVKRDWEKQVRYEAPPLLPVEILNATEVAAKQSFHVLGCRDLSRADFRVRDGVPYFLEINPLPGLNPDYSDMVILARLMGMSYETLITKIVNASLKRHQLA